MRKYLRELWDWFLECLPFKGSSGGIQGDDAEDSWQRPVYDDDEPPVEP